MCQNYTNGFTRECNLRELQLKERGLNFQRMHWCYQDEYNYFTGLRNRYLFEQIILLLFKK